MKITGISGSPNFGGNNEKLIDIALGIAEERGFENRKRYCEPDVQYAFEIQVNER